jgi:hypothetical protein
MFARIVVTPSVTLPVAGTVQNTNTLLGHNGFHRGRAEPAPPPRSRRYSHQLGK